MENERMVTTPIYQWLPEHPETLAHGGLVDGAGTATLVAR